MRGQIERGGEKEREELRRDRDRKIKIGGIETERER